jgi:formate/nitrite transporter FocA (FNT family)
MIIRLLKWQVVSDATWYRVCQALCAITACLIIAVGSIWMARLDLSLAQMFLGIGVIFSLALQFVIVCELLALKRKAA